MPVIKHPAQRVAVLIDIQNLYHSAKNLYGKRVNFKEVLRVAIEQRQLVRSFAYVVYTETEEEQSFFHALEKLGIEIRVKDLQVFYGGMKKADWDVGIAIDGVRLANSVDVIILMSGDGDFIPLVEYLKNVGTQIEVVAFGKSASSKLQEASDDFLDLSNDPEQYLLNIKKPANDNSAERSSGSQKQKQESRPQKQSRAK
ncbi:MAG: NYN domain-containing protein [Candidatus Spechtbacteria bacterium SB0662_bin_43]|uniref:NYN domain-containing protein n=1 Tax=Candidatus Spechtbacteria bacterium SB0662_bin_43 TaxID=2604897 RepID=A0A845DA67_9BACT|nr:NYN domain-containing protein [Candidatus Spechtbacteria bacterium SB0662_bin_43]